MDACYPHFGLKYIRPTLYPIEFIRRVYTVTLTGNGNDCTLGWTEQVSSQITMVVPAH
jgi:hypothetical protein